MGDAGLRDATAFESLVAAGLDEARTGRLALVIIIVEEVLVIAVGLVLFRVAAHPVKLRTEVFGGRPRRLRKAGPAQCLWRILRWFQPLSARKIAPAGRLVFFEASH